MASSSIKTSVNPILTVPSDSKDYASVFGLAIFRVSHTATADLPITGDGVIVQFRATNDALVQLCFDGWATSTTVFVRMEWGTAWRAWKQIA